MTPLHDGADPGSLSRELTSKITGNVPFVGRYHSLCHGSTWSKPVSCFEIVTALLFLAE